MLNFSLRAACEPKTRSFDVLILTGATKGRLLQRRFAKTTVLPLLFPCI